MWYKKGIKILIRNYKIDIKDLKKKETEHRYEERSFLEGLRTKLENVVEDLEKILKDG